MTEMLLYAYDFGQGAAFAWQLYFRTHAVNIIRIGSFQKSLLAWKTFKMQQHYAVHARLGFVPLRNIVTQQQKCFGCANLMLTGREHVTLPMMVFQ